MNLPMSSLFRRVTPALLAKSELNTARIELVSAERELDRATTNVEYYKRRIERLTQQANDTPTTQPLETA